MRESVEGDHVLKNLSEEKRRVAKRVSGGEKMGVVRHSDPQDQKEDPEDDKGESPDQSEGQSTGGYS